MIEYLSRLRCDVCGESLSPVAIQSQTCKAAIQAGWKVKGRHVCPGCFEKMVSEIGGDKRIARAKLVAMGKSGESYRDLAKDLGVNHQTAWNWAHRGSTVIGRPRKKK